MEAGFTRACLQCAHQPDDAVDADADAVDDACWALCFCAMALHTPMWNPWHRDAISQSSEQ
jgi:hypothetical protein